MKVLIVEDDVHKLRQLEEIVREALPRADIFTGKAYQSGLKAAVQRTPDVIVLDMSLPTYEVTATEPGGRSRPYGGREILYELKRRALTPRVIVVTGLPIFGEGEEKVLLADLMTILTKDFPGIYKGTVYYHPSETKWKGELLSLISSTTAELGLG